jgi:hypothetical protein
VSKSRLEAFLNKETQERYIYEAMGEIIRAMGVDQAEVSQGKILHVAIITLLAECYVDAGSFESFEDASDYLLESLLHSLHTVQGDIAAGYYGEFAE